MKALLALVLLGWFASGLSAQSRLSSSTLVVPPDPVDAGAPVKVGLVRFNPGERAVPFDAGASLPARLTGGSRSWPVELVAVDPAAATIPAGGYAVRTYAFHLPATGEGELVLEWVAAGATGSPAIASAPPAPPGDTAAAETGPRQDEEKRKPAISLLDRTFAERLAPHESIYFIYGPDAPGAKFQFSFKYLLFDLGSGETEDLRPSLQFGFTQRSLWDIGATSSPFYDTSYMPELILESLAPLPEKSGRFLTWLGYQAGFKHESNGRDGEISRSLNTLYFRSALAIGTLEGWRVLVAPEVFTYVGGLSNNPRLKEYRGYGRLFLSISRHNGVALGASLWAGRDFDRRSLQFDLTLPIRSRWLGFEAYLLLQHFDGYGESLLDYEEKSRNTRAGISFIR